MPGRLVGALAVLAVIAHLMGSSRPDGRWWGADALAYYPPVVAIGVTLAVLAAALLGLRRGRARNAPSPVSGAGDDSLPGWARAGLLAALSGLCFWTFRARHVFLGDGVAILSSVPEGASFHPLEPLAGVLQQLAYRLTEPLFASPTREPFEVAWLAMALLSTVAGALFVPVLAAISVRMTRLLAPGLASASGTAALLVFGVLAFQGYLQLFFGYVEVYALSVLGLAVYLFAALRFLAGRGRLWPAAAALGVAVSLHLSNLVLVPSLLVLGAVRISRREPTRALAADLGLAGFAFVAIAAGLALMGNGYNLGLTAFSIVRTVLVGQPEAFPNYFLSARHVRDFLNGQALIGPLGLFLFVPLAVAALGSRSRRTAPAMFFVALGGGFVAACVVAGDSNLGYARNWDLLAPAGFGLTAAGIGLLLPRLESPRAARGILALALVVSCAHTLPWIGVNASLSRSFQRFTTLPLDLGRVESTIGYWFELQRNPEEAEKWFVRALQKNPGNVRAHVFLGNLYSNRGEYRLATLAFRYASDLRPEKADYRLQLVDALVMGGNPAAAVPEVERVLKGRPEDPRLWSLYGIVLLGTGRTEAARQAFATAGRVAPSHWVYRTLATYADLPRGYDRALDEVWKALIGA